MANKTLGERVASVETWQADHERRCDDRQNAMGREIKQLRESADGMRRAAWGLVLAILGFLLAQTYFQFLHPAPAPAAVAIAASPH